MSAVTPKHQVQAPLLILGDLLGLFFVHDPATDEDFSQLYQCEARAWERKNDALSVGLSASWRLEGGRAVLRVVSSAPVIVERPELRVLSVGVDTVYWSFRVPLGQWFGDLREIRGRAAEARRDGSLSPANSRVPDPLPRPRYRLRSLSCRGVPSTHGRRRSCPRCAYRSPTRGSRQRRHDPQVATDRRCAIGGREWHGPRAGSTQRSQNLASVCRGTDPQPLNV